jgi:hypothetical protein
MDRSNITIFFDEPSHKYTDSNNRIYTSTTTLIGYYENKFDSKKMDIARACEKIGMNPAHPKYQKYKGKSVFEILLEWEQAKDEGCRIGNEKHNHIDNTIKLSNGYRSLTHTNFTNTRLYTINDILVNHSFGLVDLDYFKELGIKDLYPKIYNTISYFVKEGYKIYSEIGTFDPINLVSGLIDVLAIKGNKFILIDWKTNKARLMFKSGYFEKDIEGNLTDNFIENDDRFIFPLHKYPQSVGHKYTFQLSMYDYLTEGFGLECIGNILFHIRHNNYLANHEDVIENPSWIEKQQVDSYPIQYLKNDMAMLISNFNKRKASGEIDALTIKDKFKNKMVVNY